MFNDKNPYSLRTEIIDGVTHYFVSFVNGENKLCETEVPRSIYNEIHNSSRIIRNLTRFDERHVEYTELTDESLHSRALNYQKGVEDILIDIENSNKLKNGIENLPEIQRRRFTLYYEFGLTYEQISEMEGCSIRAIKYSVDIAKQKILILLKE